MTHLIFERKIAKLEARRDKKRGGRRRKKVHQNSIVALTCTRA
jgi:hypothetical protein